MHISKLVVIQRIHHGPRMMHLILHIKTLRSLPVFQMALHLKSNSIDSSDVLE